MSDSQPRGGPLKGFQKGYHRLKETLWSIQGENRIETPTGSHLFSETHPSTGSYQVTWEGDSFGDGACSGGRCWVTWAEKKKLFLNCEQKGRKNERKKEREEKCK